MFLFQNVSGAAVINYYSPTLFTSIGLADPALWTGIYGLVKGMFFSPEILTPLFKLHAPFPPSALPHQ